MQLWGSLNFACAQRNKWDHAGLPGHGAASAPLGAAGPQARTEVLVDEKISAKPGFKEKMGRALRWGLGAGGDVILQKVLWFAVFPLSLL